VLYTIHVSNGATHVRSSRARFAKDDVDGCFVQLMGVPGAGAGAIEGPTERPFRRRGVDVFAGLRDDPFFFDLTGFRQTLASGTISMINDRDFFSGMNTSALVVEFPLAAVSPGGGRWTSGPRPPALEVARDEPLARQALMLLSWPSGCDGGGLTPTTPT
jgi:hypothetical protein